MSNFNEYLIHCYLYYELNCPVIYDYDFNKLKDLISKEDLKAARCIKEYPKEIIEEAEKRKKEFLRDLQREVDWVREQK